MNQTNTTFSDASEYKDLLLLANERWLAHLKGAIVFDDFDPAVDVYLIRRKRIERLIRERKIDKLEIELQRLVHVFQFQYDEHFASFFKEKTGQTFELIPDEFKSISTARNLIIEHSGRGEHALTTVMIELPSGSGAIYTIRGKEPGLTAEWIDNASIRISIPRQREEFTRVSRICTLTETITIKYEEF